MPFSTLNVDEVRKRIKEIEDANPEAKAALDEHRREYEFRKKLVLARQEAGLTQRELQSISGLDQRAISRVESDEKVSPSVKTLMRYLGAMGYQLDIVRASQ
jgi:DNA-binding XRE family transcriptional regulator